MNLLGINPHRLLLEKALDPLPISDIEELKRIETLDVTGFSEADVRAEVIDPILRILGYRKGQDYSVDREKHIRFLGKTHRYLDYNVTLWEKNFWLIEAKKPMANKSEFGYDELSQAVEYAAHPEIEAALVVLCDGLRLDVFDREENLEKPLLCVSIPNLTDKFEDLRKLLCPMQIWFFYRRRIIRAIDRAFEHEVNQTRVNELKQIVETRLNGKRSQILENFRRMKLSGSDTYEAHLSKATVDEIIDIHFFIEQSHPCIIAMTENLVATCKDQSTFPVLHRIFPDEPRDTNDYFYMHALALLIRIEEKKLNVDLLPTWLSGTIRSDTHAAIQRLIALCLTHFSGDQARKIVLLAANAYRRIFKVLAVILPHQKQLAEVEHLVTRYSRPEFCWEQVLSSRERNVVLGWDKLCLSATSKFVKDFSKENRPFNENLAKQALQEMWGFEENILSNMSNYRQLLKECNFDELSPTEVSGVVYDNLGHGCLCLISSNAEWKRYVLNNHCADVETLANMGSWSARELLGESSKTQPARKIDNQLLADRFFFGDIAIFKKIATAYGYET